eukprot:6498511-Pyramimonas_sp.AAC.1
MAPQCESWWVTSCSAQFWRMDGRKPRATSVATSSRPRLKAEERARTRQHKAAGFLRIPRWDSPLTGISPSSPGLRQLADDRLTSGKLTISTSISSRGGEADLVIYQTTRSNKWYDWGFMGNPNRVNVAITRATTNVVIIGDGRMFGTATGSRLRELSEFGRFA